MAIWAAEQERESQARRAPVAHNARFYGREVEMSPAYLMTRLAALAGLLVLVVGSCS
ncbi:MAG TPA: hypothetical protein VK607_10515 [Kofleriaceae bacterium]|nr:hypothetical protein [Kofleriaceae bacterium]